MATHFSAVGQIRQFAGEAAADIRELRQFLKKEKALKLICLSLILVCWGLKIVYDDILLTVRSSVWSHMHCFSPGMEADASA